MNLIEKALEIALDAHRGQTDKAGAPYVLHPIRLMLRMESETLQAAAVLHDVVEDSAYTADDLHGAGIPEDVLEIVEALTKRDGEDYAAFIGRVSYNPDAIRVKLADIEDNLDVRRIDELGQKDLDRVAKYHRAWRQLRLALDRIEGHPGHMLRDEPAGEEALPKGGRLPPDHPLHRRGYVVATPGNSVYPGRRKDVPPGEEDEDAPVG